RGGGDWEAGKSYYRGTTRNAPGETGRKVLRAIDVHTGKVAWERPQTGLAHSWGGALATAGGLVFYGDDGRALAAVEAATAAPRAARPSRRCREGPRRGPPRCTAASTSRWPPAPRSWPSRFPTARPVARPPRYARVSPPTGAMARLVLDGVWLLLVLAITAA